MSKGVREHALQFSTPARSAETQTSSSSSRYPHVTFTGCTAHILDLFLEDVGKLEWVKGLVSQAKGVIKFVKLHQKPHGLYRQHEKLALLLPGRQ